MSDDDTSTKQIITANKSTNSSDEEPYNVTDFFDSELYNDTAELSSDTEELYSDTEELYNDTEESYNDSDYEEEKWILYESYILLVIVVVSLLTFIFSVASWSILKKFRNYRNFVFLNGLLLNFLLYSTLWIYNRTLEGWFDDLLFLLNEYFENAKCHWLVVISHMFYVDIVKVFKNHYLQRKYLWSTLFIWGTSLIPTIILGFIQICCQDKVVHFNRIFSVKVMNLIFWSDRILPLLINCFFYLIIVFSLYRSFLMRKHSSSNIVRRLYYASLIFILSDVFVLFDFILSAIFDLNTKESLILDFLSHVNALILAIFFFLLRSNRNVWYDFYVNNIRRRHNDGDIFMHGRIICNPADPPAVLDHQT